MLSKLNLRCYESGAFALSAGPCDHEIPLTRTHRNGLAPRLAAEPENLHTNQGTPVGAATRWLLCGGSVVRLQPARRELAPLNSIAWQV